ncbi:MAG: hypothetical protein ACKV2T_16125 [Kofleriaceae bacterium]
MIAESYRRQNALSDTARSLAHQLVSELRTLLSTGQKRWNERITPDALARALPGTAPCRYGWAAPSEQALIVDNMIVDIDPTTITSHRPSTNFVRFRQYQPGAKVPPDGLAEQAEIVEAIARRLDNGTADRTSLETLERMKRDDLGQLVLVVQTKPAVKTGDRFLPGRVTGAAYYISAPEATVECMLPLDITNSDRVDMKYTQALGDPLAEHRAGAEALERDLTLQIHRAIANGMRAVEGS